MAKPTRGWSARFGSEPCAISTWWSDIWPGCQHDVDRVLLLDLDRDLLAAAQQVVGARRSRGAAGSASGGCPGTTRMQPLSTVLGVSATQAVTMSDGSRPQ